MYNWIMGESKKGFRTRSIYLCLLICMLESCGNCLNIYKNFVNNCTPRASNHYGPKFYAD